MIGGIITWLNRRGGCTKRTKRNKDGLSHDDYTIDMHQNDFANHGSSAAAAAAAAAATGGVMGAGGLNHKSSVEPLSPFDRRYTPTANPGYEQPYTDYHDVYSQGGYSQDGYNSQGAYSQQGDYPPAMHQQGEYGMHDGYGMQPQGDYGYYDTGYNNQQQQGYDSTRHEYYDPQQQKHYSDITSPTSAGNMSETGGYTSSKPNVKDFNSKPNEL